MTGVLMMPIGAMLPHPAPVALGALPMFLVHTTAPVDASSANTSLPVVAMKNTPRPAGPFSR